MTEITQEMLIDRAKEISAKKGVSLSEAMERAEVELLPKPERQTKFVVELELKPRLASWVVETFQATATHTMEQRLAAYISTILSRDRVRVRRFTEPTAEVVEGQAVTVRRDQIGRFQK